MNRITGRSAFLALLKDEGITHLFGNPGTTELPLNDVLAADQRIQYILGLQEVPVMSMADGYAMASGSLSVANVHICCGLGNAMGMLYNALREGTPLLLTAGQQYTYRFTVPTIQVGWVDLSSADPYAGGRASSFSNWDFLFQVFIRPVNRTRTLSVDNGVVNVESLMRLIPQPIPPPEPSAGDVYYDEALNQLRYFNGTIWVSL